MYYVHVSSGNLHLCPLKLQELSQQYQTTVAQHGNSCYELLHQKVLLLLLQKFCYFVLRTDLLVWRRQESRKSIKSFIKL